MNLLILGAPGAGKGTAATAICQQLGIPHISTGDILRSAIKNQTELGRQAKALIDDGNFVPDELIIGVVRARLKEPDAQHGFMLDGFPRTLFQAQQFTQDLKQEGTSIDHALMLEMTDAAIVERLAGRRVNATTGKVYHLQNNPPKVDGICDDDGSSLIQRSDDEPKTILHRLSVYHQETEPVVEFYEKLGLLARFDGSSKPEIVVTKILALIEASSRQSV